jgi:hypothetical protein
MNNSTKEPSEDLKSLTRQFNEVFDLYKMHSLQLMPLVSKISDLSKKMYQLSKAEGIEYDTLPLKKWSETELKRLKEA